MLGYAISLDLLAFNAAKDVEVLSTRADEAKQIIPPSKEVVRQLLEPAEGNFRVKLLFAAATGLRAGEFHALRWHHISFERREVKVLTRVDPYGDEDVPKTRARKRTIPLGKGVLTALQGWRQRTKFKAQDDLVFPTTGHDPVQT